LDTRQQCQFNAIRPNADHLQAEMPVRPTRNTFVEINQRVPEHSHQELINYHYEFTMEAVRIIKSSLADRLVDGNRYEKTG
jgi:hypothetical protein